MHKAIPTLETWIVFNNLLFLKSHSLIVPSILPDATVRESGDKSKQVTSS
jgi:hypothetical protein